MPGIRAAAVHRIAVPDVFEKVGVKGARETDNNGAEGNFEVGSCTELQPDRSQIGPHRPTSGCNQRLGRANAPDAHFKRICEWDNWAPDASAVSFDAFMATARRNNARNEP